MSNLEVPDHAGRAAFVELTEVVRNVSEQLAGYRRRALSAEARLRELEQAVEGERAAVASLKETAAQVASLEEALRATRAEADERGVALEAAQMALDQLQGQRAQEQERRPMVAGTVAGGSEGREELESLNAALRDRLDEANARTSQIVERVRFLRQQLSTGARA